MRLVTGDFKKRFLGRHVRMSVFALWMTFLGLLLFVSPLISFFPFGPRRARGAPTLLVKGRVDMEGLSVFPFTQEREPKTILTARAVDRDLRKPIEGLSLIVDVRCGSKAGRSFRTVTTSSGRWAVAFSLCPSQMTVKIEAAKEVPYVVMNKKGYRLWGSRTNVRLDVEAPSEVPLQKREFSITAKALRDVPLERLGDSENLAKALEEASVQWAPLNGKRVTLLMEMEDKKKHLRTNAKGEAVFRVKTEELTGPGRHDFTLEVHDGGSVVFKSFEVMVVTTPRVTLQSNKKRGRAGQEAVLTGVVKENGKALAGARIHIRAHRKTVAAARSNGEGKFTATVKLGNLPLGKNRLVATLVPREPWRRPARSKAVPLFVYAPKPLPILLYAVPVLLTAIVVLGVVALRRKPWKRWVRFVRQRREKQAKKGVRTGRTRLSSLLGKGIFWVRGRVVDRNGDEPLSGVKIQMFLETSDRAQAEGEPSSKPVKSRKDGGFEVSQLDGGDYLVVFEHPGYLKMRVEVTVPHRGRFDGFLVRMVSIRDRVVEMYLAEAARWLQRRSLVGVLTPREVLDRLLSGWQKPNEKARKMTFLVEKTVYSPAIPVEEAVDELRQLLDALPEEFGRSAGGTGKSQIDTTGPFTLDDRKGPSPLTPQEPQGAKK